MGVDIVKYACAYDKARGDDDPSELSIEVIDERTLQVAAYDRGDLALVCITSDNARALAADLLRLADYSEGKL